MKKKKLPFKLNCFGFLGIMLLLSGIGSGFLLYFTIKY